MGPWRWPLLWCLHATLVHSTILTGGQRLQERPPRPAGWSSAPSSSWAPTLEPGASGDPEGSAAARAFLQTGDAQQLARANCSQGVAAGAPSPGPPPALRAALRAAPEALAHAANFLNMLFQTNDIREASVAEDVEWYQALVRSLAEGHPWVRRAVLALDAHPLASKPRLMLQATKGDGEILLQDISAAAPSLGNLSWDNEWFNALKSQRTPLLRKRVLSNDLRSMETPKWQRGDSYVGEPGHVRWSPPFLQCQDGRFLPAWAVTLSSAFYGLKPDLSPEFKGVVRVDIELRDVAIDQCASGPGWFADTHRCDLNSTQESRTFVLGRYLCRCKPGFYGAGGAASTAQAGAAGAEGGSRLACRPCRQGCITCEDDAPCLIQEDQALRAAVLSCQACCMLAVFLSMLVSYHFRQSKRIRASGVILLETILFGSLLLYFPVFILYFKPSIFRCIVLRWVRMLGFAIVYGTITLKLYRVLKVFLSHTAQRVPYMSSGRVLKMLGLILLLVLWFLAAWTIGMLENVDKNIPLVIRTQTAHGLHFYICGHDRWDYMMVIAEMLFLLWGSFLCYATRGVPSAFHEPRYMGIALHNELMISAAFHIVRFVMVPSLHPDWTLLLFFAHTHGTITMTLALLFIPKFLHAGSPLQEEIAAEVYEDELDIRHSNSCLNSSIASAWSEHSLDPDDIREELKKLYMQLETRRTRKMAANNPHIPKKRSSRRSLGRSIVRRVAELPKAVARRSGKGERVGTLAHHSSSAKQLASVRMRDNRSWRRTTALHKSRSIEDPGWEPQGGAPTPSPTGEPTPGRKTMATMASEQSDIEALDTAPLVCKSSSTHNLVGHMQHPSPRAARLQKSLSVVTGAREEALLTTSRAVREWNTNWHPPTPSPGCPVGQGHPEQDGKAQSPCPAGHPQDDASPLGTGKVQKHVTYAPIKSMSIDSSHLPGRVRVTVRRTPPPPPVRYESLGQRAADSPEPAEPRMDPPAQTGEPEGTPAGTAEEDLGHVFTPAGKGRLQTAVSIPAYVCPWELIQEEILSRKQKATEVADSGTLSDAAASPRVKSSSQNTSLQGLGLALKAFNRSRGKSILKGKREGEGILRQRGHEWEGANRRERPSLAGTSAMSLGWIGQDSAAKTLEWSRQRPSSKPSASLWQGDTVPRQHNNNAGTVWEAAGWGDSEAEGQWDSAAPGTGDGEKPAEEPSAPQGDVDAGGVPGPPLGVREMPPGVGHQEGAEQPCETPEVAGSGKAQVVSQQATEAHIVEPGEDAPAATVRLIAPKEGVAGPADGLEGGSRSIPRPQDHAEVEQPPAIPTAGSPDPSRAGARSMAAEKPRAEVCPRGTPGISAGKGTLLRQEAVTSQEDSRVPPDEESPVKALQKASSQPEPLGAGRSQGAERVPARSRSMEVAPAAPGKAGSTAGRQAQGSPGETQADSSIKTEICPWKKSKGERWGLGKALEKGGSEGDPLCPREEPGTEKLPAKTPELPKAALEPKAGSGEGRRAEVCLQESGEEGRTIGAEICPLDVEGAQLEQEGQEGERCSPKWVESIRPKSPGLLSTQESGGSLQAPGWPSGTTGSEGLPPQPAPKGSELPEVTSRSPVSTRALSMGAFSTRALICPWEAAGARSVAAEVCPWEMGTALSDAEKLDDGVISHVKNGISPQRAAPRGTGETALAADKDSSQQGSPRPGDGAEQPGTGLLAKHPALLKTPPKQAGTIDSKNANICPWEAQDEPLHKTEICPWEDPTAPSVREGPSQDARGMCKEENKRGSRGPEDIRAKLAEMDRHWPERRNTRIFAKLVRKSLELSKAESKKTQSVESIKEEVCPQESLCMEQPPGKPHTGSKALPKSTLTKSESVESPTAEVCPWETQEVEATAKAEICPWEVAAAPSDQPKAEQGPGGVQMGDKRIRRQAALANLVRSLQKSSSERQLVCPWESLGTEQPPEKNSTRSPVLPKSSLSKSESLESLKAEVCPWEAQDVEAIHKAQICPWEAAAPPSGTEKSSDNKDGLSIGSKTSSASQVLCKDAGDGTSAKEEKERGDHESVCPWESLGMEQPPEQPHAGSTVLPKSPSKESHSVGSLKAEVCPWELEPTDKAEICPWEVAAPPSGKEKSSEYKHGLSIGSKSISARQGLHKDAGDSTSAKEEKESGDRDSVCPGESLGTEEHTGKPRARRLAMRKLPSKKSQSDEILKAEVCPWEAQDVEAIHKAEICPWEVAAPPSGTEKSSEDKDGLSIGSKSSSASQGLHKDAGDGTSAKEERASGDRESICPWESLGMEPPPEQPHAGSTVLPKSPSKESHSVESLKAEICPWEAPELEPTDKAEICPWEVAAPPSGKEKSSDDKDGLSIGSKSSSASQGRHKDAGDGTSAKEERASGDRESVCPWEVTDREGTSVGYDVKSTEPVKATAKKWESMGSVKADVSPRESLDTEQTTGKPRARRLAMRKLPSKKSQSDEILKAEVCPWEAQDTEAIHKAEICPWEVAAPPSGTEKSSDDKDGLSIGSKSSSASQGLHKDAGDGTSAKEERTSGDRESVCPWESLGTEPPPEQPHAGSTVLPKSPSKESHSVGSLKAEVCPWEAPELKPSDKAEICPWEAAAPLPEKGAAPGKGSVPPNKAGASKSHENGSSDCEAICPWESLGTHEPSLTTMGEEPSKKSDSTECRKSDICPWEEAEPTGLEQPVGKPRARRLAVRKLPSKKSQSDDSLKAEVCPWEAQDVEAIHKAEICPWEVAAPPSGKEKSSEDKDGLSIGSKSSSASQGLHKDAGDGTSAKEERASGDRESVCPWESLGTEQPPEQPHAGSTVLPKSPSKESHSVGSLKAEVCPWEAPELKPSDKAEICPWEVAAHPSDQPKAKQGPGEGSKRDKRIRRQAALASPERSPQKGSSEPEAVCPQESLGTEQPPEQPHGRSTVLPKSPSKESHSVERQKAEVCPWEALELEPTHKAEICPWEVAAPPSGKEKSSDDKDGLSIGSKSSSASQGLRKDTGDSTSAKEERASRDSESICPGESLGMEQPTEKPRARRLAMRKLLSRKTQSDDSLKAEVCPWEAQDVEAIHKAEICPWEAAAPPSGTEKSSEDKDGLSIGSKSSSASQGLHKVTEHSTAAQEERASGDRESVCPWESLGTEPPPEQPHAGSTVLPKSPSKESHSVGSLKAEVCPWEAPELKPSDKAEICPWEAAAPLPEKGAAPGKGSVPPNKAGASKSHENGSSDCEAICPWESLGTHEPSLTTMGEEPSKKSDSTECRKSDICPWEEAEPTGLEQPVGKPRARRLAVRKLPSKKSQSDDSLKAEVCPWEAQDVEAIHKAEICPWEVAAPPSGTEKSSEDKDGLSIGSKSSSASQGLHKDAGDGTSAKEERASGDRESICPWESLGTEQPPEQPHAGSTVLPKSPSKESHSVGSLKAEVCPWEAPELKPSDKAEICPWEAAAHPSDQPKAKQGPGEGSKRDKRIRRQAALASPERSPQKGSSEPEAVCPQESLGTEQPPEQPHGRSTVLPKSPSKESHSVESLKAEVCPWEAPELEPTHKAEICPWEVAAPPSGKEKSSDDKDGLSIGSKSSSASQGLRKDTGDSTSAKEERASRDSESICPGESLGMEQPTEKPRARRLAMRKLLSRKTQSDDSLKAEVCPWEAQDVEAIHKAEICPWEAAAPPSGTEKSSDDKDGLSIGSKSSSASQGLHKVTEHSTAAKKERASGDRESVCPWESLGTEPPPEQPHGRSTVLPKSPSKESHSVGSLKAEVCPWEAPELKPSDKAEICPWEAAAPLPEKGAAPGKGSVPPNKAGASKSHENGSSDCEAICPWESLGTHEPSLTTMGEEPSKKSDSTECRKSDICPWEEAEPTGLEQPAGKPRTRRLAVRKLPSKKSQSDDSLKAEVCPWEAQDVEAIHKAEICPWEVAAPPSGTEKSSEDKDGLSIGSKSSSASQGLHKDAGDGTSAKEERASGDRESICPWESLGMEPPPEQPHGRSTVLPKSPSKESHSVGSLKAEVCPWEAPELEPTHKAEICPWEAAAPPSGTEKSSDDKDGLSIGSKSSSASQGLHKVTEHSTAAKKERASGDRESVCPWESLGTELPPEQPHAGSTVLPKSPSKESHSVGSLKAEVCPWEAPELKPSDKAEICPWEAAAHPSDQPKAKQGPGEGSKRDKRIRRQAALASPERSPQKGSSEPEAVCPWESMGTEQPPEQPHGRSTVLPKSPSKESHSVESLKAEVCPWEAPELKPTHKAEICPWEVAAPPSGTEKSSDDKDGLSIGSKSSSASLGLHKVTEHSTAAKKERASGDRESVSPLESLGTELPPEQPHAGSTVLPKSPSKESHSVGSLKAEVCPWEAPELKPSDKAEICPWEAAAPLPEKGAAPGKGSVPPNKAGASKSHENGSSDCEAICPWESLGTQEPSLTATGEEPSKKSDSTECRKSDICPWGAAEPTGSEKENFKPGVCPQGANRASPARMGKLVAGASTASASALLKISKGISDGTAEHKPLCRIQAPQGPRAEPLPGGVNMAPMAGSSPSPGTTVAEVCPWEEEGGPPAPKSSTDTGESFEVCPWEAESVDPTLTLREQGKVRVSPGDGDRGVSESKPDVCPWDHE